MKPYCQAHSRASPLPHISPTTVYTPLPFHEPICELLFLWGCFFCGDCFFCGSGLGREAFPPAPFAGKPAPTYRAHPDTL